MNQFYTNVSSGIVAPADQKPLLIVVVDTEEEFDWSEKFSSDATSVTAIASIFRAQRLFDEFKIRPVYVVDYPIAENTYSIEIMADVAKHGNAYIGAHLQPWVNPPFEEEIGTFNSYAGNLPEDLERRKLFGLCELIEKNFGSAPRYYKAGRYGLGKNSVKILKELGFEFDFSVSPGFDFSNDHGPNYLKSTQNPFYLDQEEQVLELPTTSAIIGPMAKVAKNAYTNMGSQNELVKLSRGVMARTHLLQRVRLSPEGYTIAEMIWLTRHLYAQGVRVFNFSFHSPSLKPGCTSYVEQLSDLWLLLDRCRRYFEFFTDELAGEFTTPDELKDLCEGWSAR